MKVCWISNAPAPYKVAFMNLLGKEVDLYCLFETKAEKDREKEWYDYGFANFHAIYLNNKNEKETIKQMAKECDLLINSDYSKKVCMYAVYQFHKQKKKVIMHADGGIVIPRGIIDKAISYVMRQNDFYLSSGEETDKYYEYYGIPKNKIYHYHFACMSNLELAENEKMLINKSTYRKECGYKEEIILLSVGRQIPGKGYDVLAKAMIEFPNNIGLYIVGGKPEEKVKQIVEENHLNNIHFVDFKNKEELKKYYAGADIFVFPTRSDVWGLVVNEAMSFGLPIISTNKCVAAMEFNRKFKNTEIVEVDNALELTKAIKKLVENKDFVEKLSKNSLSGIKEYSFENMVEDFLSCFKKIEK